MALTPSQRINLIKEISFRLSGEEWTLIDLTLKQYSLPRSDQWSGDKLSYVVQMIDLADDQKLIDLAQHVGFHVEQSSGPRIDPPFWRNGMLRIFLSHLAEYRAYAAELQEALLKYGISCFVAHNDIQPTAEWQVQIETALATCDGLIAVLHPNFHISNWTDQEIGFAMGRGVPTFAVRYGQDPYGFIGRFQAFTGLNKTAAVLANELFGAFRTNKQSQRRMSEVLINLFEESGSFAQAKVRIGYLEELEIWDPSFSARIKAATEGNSQISGSWGVPERVVALAKKWANLGAG